MINKVITSYQDVDNMEEINTITGINPFATDNWCDFSEFEDYEKLKDFITEEEYLALKNGNTDYIAFRIDY